MTTGFANIKKFAVVAAMATTVTATGWVLASGTAQADRRHDPDPHPSIVVNHQQMFQQTFDNFVDRFYGEGTPVDRFFDPFLPGVK